jgi:hypothetical protein
MKKLFTIIILVISFKSYSQVIADPALTTMGVITFDGTPVNEYELVLDNTYRLKIPIYNKNQKRALPAGTCNIKIGLGSKMTLSPAFNLLNVNTSQYFDWTANFYGGQFQLTGDLKATLPANFRDTAYFDIIGNIAGVSTVTNNFLITNHNTNVILSDEDPTNNTTFLPYVVITPVPVTFSSLSAIKKGCNIDILFVAESELNVNKYEIETSKDGIHFNKIGETQANNRINYRYSFNLSNINSASLLYFRIKSLDRDGRFQYSQTKTVNGICADKLSLELFPNPVHQEKLISIKAATGIFEGDYEVRLYDAVGKLLDVNRYTLSNTPNLNYNIRQSLATGGYVLRVVNLNDSREYFNMQVLKVN